MTLADLALEAARKLNPPEPDFYEIVATALLAAVHGERECIAKFVETIGGRDDLAAIIRVGGHV